MSIVGDFTIPAEAFALQEALSRAPEVIIEADRLASHSPEEVFPFLWATGVDADRFRRSLADDPTVSEADIADETDDEVLYRMTWSDEFESLIHSIVDHHAAILEARASDERWNLRLRFAEEAMVSEFQSYFRDNGHRFEVRQLHHPTEPRQRVFGLTEEQHEALVAATEAGYFDVPRTASAEEVSDRLGVSANAFSERLRRGSKALVESGLTVSGDGE